MHIFMFWFGLFNFTARQASKAQSSPLPLAVAFPTYSSTSTSLTRLSSHAFVNPIIFTPLESVGFAKGAGRFPDAGLDERACYSRICRRLPGLPEAFGDPEAFSEEGAS